MKSITVLGLSLTLIYNVYSLPSHAQQNATYPSKPIRVIVPFVSGGPMDLIGRIVGQQFTKKWGQNFIIDNRGGAAGTIGTETAAKSAADGYTLLHTSSAHAMLPAFNKLNYDPVQDFSAITTAARMVGYVLCVHPNLSAHNVSELIALAKKNPSTLNYGTSGYGGVLHMANELFNAAAEIKMTPVHYKGVGQVVTDLAGGHINLSFMGSSNTVSVAKTGKIRPLAISGAKRWKQLPEVPTISESGLKDFTYYAWFGFWFPANTPKDIVQRMHETIASTVREPTVITRFDELGFEPYILSSEAFTQLVQSDIKTTKKIAEKIDKTSSGAAPLQ